MIRIAMQHTIRAAADPFSTVPQAIGETGDTGLRITFIYEAVAVLVSTITGLHFDLILGDA